MYKKARCTWKLFCLTNPLHFCRSRCRCRRRCESFLIALDCSSSNCYASFVLHKLPACFIRPLTHEIVNLHIVFDTPCLSPPHPPPGDAKRGLKTFKTGRRSKISIKTVLCMVCSCFPCGFPSPMRFRIFFYHSYEQCLNWSKEYQHLTFCGVSCSEKPLWVRSQWFRCRTFHEE